MLQSLLSSATYKTNSYIKALPAIAKFQLHQKILTFEESPQVCNNFNHVEKEKGILKRGKIENPKYQKLVAQIKGILYCTDNRADVFIAQSKKLWQTSVAKMSGNIEYLLDKKISVATINENVWLLGISFGRCVSKRVGILTEFNLFF